MKGEVSEDNERWFVGEERLGFMGGPSSTTRRDIDYRRGRER